MSTRTFHDSTRSCNDAQTKNRRILPISLPSVVFEDERELFVSSSTAACLAIVDAYNFENFRNEFTSLKAVDTNFIFQYRWPVNFLTKLFWLNAPFYYLSISYDYAIILVSASLFDAKAVCHL